MREAKWQIAKGDEKWVTIAEKGLGLISMESAPIRATPYMPKVEKK